jgi:hypothetical protein
MYLAFAALGVATMLALTACGGGENANAGDGDLPVDGDRMNDAVSNRMKGQVPAKMRTGTMARQSLCRPDEQVMFLCRLGRSTASLCAGAGAEGRYVQYRFGRPGAVELAFPERGSTGLSWANTGYSGGGEVQVNFRNGDHLYVLYSRTVRTGFGPDGHFDPEFQAGVAVVRGNRIVSDRRCENSDDFIQSPETRLPEGEFTPWWDLEE